MRCSSFEALLDEYVDGELPARERALVAAHISGCPGCTSLLTELRVIDALLLVPRKLEPSPNFSFKVMAEVRSVPPPPAHRISALRVAGTYLAFAWIAIGAFFAFGGTPARAAWAAALGSAVHVRDSFGALSGATASLFGPHTFGVTAAMSGLLALDVFAALGIACAVYVARTRQTAAVTERERA